MNKLMFWSGFGMFALEVIIIIGYLLVQLDYSWINTKLIIVGIGGLIILILNVFAFIFMLYGAFSND